MADRIGPVAVLGATGAVGSALLVDLAARGVRPLAVVRPGSGGPSRDVADVVEGDLTRPESLLPALTGARTLLLLTPLHPAQDSLQRAIVEVAKEAGVERVVKVSALGADPAARCSIHRQHGLVEEALAESGLRHTLVRPNGFAQNLRQWLPGITARGAIALPVGDAEVSWVDVRDVAAVAAVALTDPALDGAVLEVTGPRALDYPTVAGYFSRELGREVRFVDVSPEAAFDAMTGAGMPPWAAEARLGLYATYRAGEAALVTTTVEDVVGRPARALTSVVGELLGRTPV
ncbi:NAD(P)H-binding protein [Saccharothrix australiensis]|uniref:Uncharacterized protein YbjT (DUF2867 family) n=1 Tax=Saccharothrix australiensis TaxID=2072 RepID=A0A495W1Z4_9PSEU|nr:NAD(P)H-binding protein [Saccharothrix australiensis]RKT55711.1 uncharacterized protein YbjT (DUF2867 family) [Saccharothrix australiensis]